MDTLTRKIQVDVSELDDLYWNNFAVEFLFLDTQLNEHLFIFEIQVKNREEPDLIKLYKLHSF